MGKHLLGNLYGCSAELLERVDIVKHIMYATVKKAGFKPVGDVFHQYEPFGVTGVILISNSHFSIHTWPEHNFLAVDIFSCSKDTDVEAGFEILCELFEPERVEKQVIDR